MRYFGTDGIRREGDFFFEERFLSRFAFAIHKLGAKQVVIGRDTRVSGERIENELSRELTEFGVEVVILGIVPTPEVCYYAKEYSIYGIMISASHNPPNYNGLKLIDKNGNKTDDEIERQVEDYIDTHYAYSERSAAITHIDGKADYMRRIIRNSNVRFDGMRILLDCSYGSASHLAKNIFSALGAQVDTICDEYRGDKINVGCGATCLDNLDARGYDIAFSYDGDADRLIAKASDNRVLDGDNLIYLLCEYYDVSKVCVSVMSNIGMEHALTDEGREVIRVPVGDKYIQNYMDMNPECILGAEQSGHIITPASVNTGDGILSSVRVLEAMKSLKMRSTQIPSLYKAYPQILNNISCDKRVLEYADFTKVEGMLNGKGRILVRASGTEALVRILIESQKVAHAKKCMKVAMAVLKDAEEKWISNNK